VNDTECPDNRKKYSNRHWHAPSAEGKCLSASLTERNVYD
jgi:hypothetical protein